MRQTSNQKLVAYIDRWVLPVLIGILVSLVFMVPFLLADGNFRGDDLAFHVQRALGLKTILQSPINFLSKWWDRHRRKLILSLVDLLSVSSFS